jgi:hypothetical protein
LKADEFRQRLLQSAMGGFVVKDNLTGAVYTLGSPGMTIHAAMEFTGFEKLSPDTSKSVFTLHVDLPLLLGLPNDMYELTLPEIGQVAVHHSAKVRGQEEFSTLGQHLPYFSHLAIVFRLHANAGRTSPEQVKATLGKAFEVIIQPVVGKLCDALSHGGEKVEIRAGWGASFRVLAFAEGDDRHPVARAVFPYRGRVKVDSPASIRKPDDQELRARLRGESVKIGLHAAEALRPQVEGESFRKTLFLAVHDMAYYSRQHARSLGELDEEQLRDLFLVVLKVLFATAEGEVFTHDGRSDVKVTNPKNKYEYASIEFKWWSGESSFREAFMQLARKHTTGQEADAYLVMLNRNLDASAVWEQMRRLIEEEPEVTAGSEQSGVVPPGSKEWMAKYEATIRGVKVAVTMGMFNLYHRPV